jgi:hypothetical protein
MRAFSLALAGSFRSKKAERVDMNGQLLEELERLTGNTGRSIPGWLADLVVCGPRLEEWPSDPAKPNRMVLTEFLARWLKFAGLSQEDCQQWLLAYCCEVLAQYAKSSPSAIRHGTKATTRYVYRSPFPFDFEAMVDDRPEIVFPGQPAYVPILQKWRAELDDAKRIARESYRPPEFPPALPPVKERYREQFENALALARQQREKGARLEIIVKMLNDQGFLTRTGRRWNIGTLVNSLKKKT